MRPLRSLRPFHIAAGLLVLTILVMEHINGRFWLNDLRVYYMAVDNLRHGLPVYGEVFGEDTGVYKYAPVVLYFFLPATWLPFGVAAVIHFLLSGLLLVGCFTLMERLMQHHFGALPNVPGRALLGLLCIAVLLTRELHMGNINAALLWLVLVGMHLLAQGRPSAAGLALGAAWLVKPYLLLMVVPLVVRREWRVLRTALFTMLVGLALPLVIQGYGRGLNLTLAWFASMVGHSEMLTSPDHIAGIWQACTGIALSATGQLLIIALAGLLLAALALRDHNRHREHHDLARSMELWLAMALVPNLVVTDQEHFLFSLPLILFVLAGLFSRKDPGILVLFVAAMLLYGTRSSDLWGRALEGTLAGHGVLGMGNLLLIAVACLSWHRSTKAPDRHPPEAG